MPRGDFWKSLKSNIVRFVSINDTPARIALGLGIGVFSGILPGTGVIAALFLAMALRANRLAAILGSLLTNTWFSIITFLLSIKVGSAIMNTTWREIYNEYALFIKEFNWGNLLKASTFKIILPLIIGYIIVAFCAGLVVYLMALLIIKIIRRS